MCFQSLRRKFSFLSGEISQNENYFVSQLPNCIACCISRFCAFQSSIVTVSSNTTVGFPPRETKVKIDELPHQWSAAGSGRTSISRLLTHWPPVSPACCSIPANRPATGARGCRCTLLKQGVSIILKAYDKKGYYWRSYTCSALPGDVPSFFVSLGASKSGSANRRVMADILTYKHKQMRNRKYRQSSRSKIGKSYQKGPFFIWPQKISMLKKNPVGILIFKRIF